MSLQKEFNDLSKKVNKDKMVKDQGLMEMLTLIENMCVLSCLDEDPKSKILEIFKVWKNFKIAFSRINNFSIEDKVVLKAMFGDIGPSSKLDPYNKTLLDYTIEEILQALNKQMSRTASFLGMTKCNDFTLDYKNKQGEIYTSPFLKQIEKLINSLYKTYEQFNHKNRFYQFQNFQFFAPPFAFV